MLSKEVSDVLFRKRKPLDVPVWRVPHCSMPASEAAQIHVTTAYVYDPQVAAYVNASLQARKAQGLLDCSSGPEKKIFDQLWRGQEMSEGNLETRGFEEPWGLVSSDHAEWKDVLHVDHWADAQHVQRQGVLADSELLPMSRRDQGRRIWPVAKNVLDAQSVGMSNAVKAVHTGYPWSGAGFDLSLGMSATFVGPGEDRSALLAAAQSPSSMTPAKGTSSSAASVTAKGAGTSSSCRRFGRRKLFPDRCSRKDQHL